MKTEYTISSAKLVLVLPKTITLMASSEMEAEELAGEWLRAHGEIETCDVAAYPPVEHDHRISAEDCAPDKMDD